MGRPRKSDSWTADLLNERAREYFDKCDSRIRMVATKEGLVPEDHPDPYSIEGLCVDLDITRDDVKAWRKRPDPLGDRARKIHLRITANRVSGALDGTQNSAFAQFMLKNNDPDDYRDRVEVENSVSESTADLFERCIASWLPR